MKVLLVDDSRSARRLIAHYLTEMGHEAVEAENGEAALSLYVELEPDLVLTDVDMPGMNGYALARQLRRSDPPDTWIPIIFLSSRIRDEDVSQGVDAGGDDYLAKPISPVVLNAKLRAMSRITDMRRKLMRTSQELQAANRNLLRMSSVDGLTNIANRRAFDARLRERWQTCRQNGEPLALILGDIDYFKRYNDSYGHADGDDCLRDVAAALASATESAEITARFGGEEFAILVNGPVAEAVKLAEAGLTAVRQLGRPHAQSQVASHVTMSLGVAACVPSTDLRPINLIQTADEALYAAKGAGRNQWIARPDFSQPSPQRSSPEQFRSERPESRVYASL
ncbi:MAG: diguanylate cyclase [Abyssibacter sp.]|uniref:diguanylate cyclase domain-containing protein n=1 Tax=Abyssibacter sp. TaxID=2320200 RepID=UPI00321C08FA